MLCGEVNYVDGCTARSRVSATEFSRLVFLESRIASPVASIGGELEREAGGPRPLRHLV
jgi:hypothetical protein